MGLTRWACMAAAVLLSAACARIEPPTGGPVDSIAPILLTTRPDSGAIVPGWTGPAIFVYDDGLSEQGVEEAVTLSPRRGPVAVDKEGDEIRVRPRRGWAPGLIYQVEVAPGLRDRFNNVIREPARLVFSTGPPIPDTRAAGRVTDRITGAPSLQARVDALRLSDSLVYSTLTDSAGRYTLAQVPEGEYRVTAYRDANRNLRVDPFEQRDTVVLVLVAADTRSADLALLPNDTTPPVAGSARMTDGWIEVRFDDYLDPDQPLSPEQVTVVGPDSAAVAIAEVRVGAPPAARDTAGADSAGLEPGPGARRPGDARPAPDSPAAADSARADTVPPAGPLPAQSLFARPAVLLVPDTTYVVRVRDVRNINGLVGGGEAPLRTPAPPPPPAPADTAAADSAAPGPPLPSVGADTAGAKVGAEAGAADSAGVPPNPPDAGALPATVPADTAAPPAPPPPARRASAAAARESFAAGDRRLALHRGAGPCARVHPVDAANPSIV